jgi:hypothetical protein
MESLLDFGEGFFSGASTGAKISGGNPLVTGASALGLGALSYVGGAPQRRLEGKANRLTLAGMEQDLELGEMNISKARRAEQAEREAKRRKETFGRLLGEYFKRKKGGV